MSQELEILKNEFAQWRATKNGRKKQPEELLKKVTELPKEVSNSKICNTLNLDWQKVKKLRSKKVSKEPKFVELPGLPSIKEVVIERTDGCKMTFSVSSESEVGNILKSFLGG